MGTIYRTFGGDAGKDRLDQCTSRSFFNPRWSGLWTHATFDLASRMFGHFCSGCLYGMLSIHA